MGKNITKKELENMLNEEKNKNVELQNILNQKEDEIKKLNERIIRMQADFDNYIKNINREKSELIKMLSVDIVKEFIDDLENIERLEKQIEDQKIKESIELIKSHMEKTLMKFGLEKIESLGKKFDPYLHEAINIEYSDNGEDGIIVEEYRKGYKINGVVVRPSMVKVIKRR
ncbi:MAG: nucleotide exchange factor GrpE [Thermoplasmata archaeon]|jgi:molecular chaperone GrpE